MHFPALSYVVHEHTIEDSTATHCFIDILIYIYNIGALTDHHYICADNPLTTTFLELGTSNSLLYACL
jgi:hypothetical protein